MPQLQPLESTVHENASHMSPWVKSGAVIASMKRSHVKHQGVSDGRMKKGTISSYWTELKFLYSIIQRPFKEPKGTRILRTAETNMESLFPGPQPLTDGLTLTRLNVYYIHTLTSRPLFHMNLFWNGDTRPFGEDYIRSTVKHERHTTLSSI